MSHDRGHRMYKSCLEFSFKGSCVVTLVMLMLRAELFEQHVMNLVNVELALGDLYYVGLPAMPLGSDGSQAACVPSVPDHPCPDLQSILPKILILTYTYGLPIPILVLLGHKQPVSLWNLCCLSRYF